MSDLNTAGLKPEVTKIIQPFLSDIVNTNTETMAALYITGSALTDDYLPKKSDINTLLIVDVIKPELLDFLAALGKKYGKKGIAAPLLMTPHYIERSLDVYPIEFLDLQSIHHLVYGIELLENLKISKSNLRLQAERELRGVLVNLHQSYIRTAGNLKDLTQLLIIALTSFIPIFRALLHLKDDEAPPLKRQVIKAFENAYNIDMYSFEQILEIKTTGTSLKITEMKSIFNNSYHTLEKIIEAVDVLEV